MIFHDVPVFIDSRADLFSKAGILADGFSLIHLQNIGVDDSSDALNVEGLIGKYQFDYFIVDQTTPFYVYLEDHSEKYKLIYKDENAAFFCKNEDN